MSILIVGADGNMGQRYKAVLTYLGKEQWLTDVETPMPAMVKVAKEADGIIIATPTHTHTEIIRQLIPAKKPILCEKPVTTDIYDLQDLTRELEKRKVQLSMVMQYKTLLKEYSQGPSYYDYFKHGNDGLFWDCIQIIGLAADEPLLREESPVWKCAINGQEINVGQMDYGYIGYVDNWLLNPKQDLKYLLDIHKKTDAMEAKYLESTGCEDEYQWLNIKI